MRPAAGSPQAKQRATEMKDKHGAEFYMNIGKIGGAATKAKRSREFFVEIGRKGGESTKARLGKAHYSAIGRIGGKVKRKPAES